MKLIEVLNRLVDNTNIPDKIIVDNIIWEYNKASSDYYSEELNDWLFEYYLRSSFVFNLNGEAKIIDKENKHE